MKTIRSRLIFWQCCVILVLTLILEASTYVFICEILETRNKEAYSKILNTAEVIMNNTLVYYEDIARLILENDVVQKVLASRYPDNENSIFMANTKFQALEDELSIYANGVENIDSLYVFNNEGKIFYADSKVKSMDVIKYVDYKDIQKSDWYQEALKANGKEVFTGYNVLNNDNRSFSCVKVINSLHKCQKIGFIVLNIKRVVLDAVFRPDAVREDMYGIFCCHNGKRQLVYQIGFEEMNSKETLSEVLENKKQDYEITSHLCQVKNWEMLHIVHKENVTREARRMRMLIIRLGLITVLVTAVIMVYQVYHITKSLYQLHEDIRLVRDGNYNFKHSYKMDEIGMIGNEFQKMVRERIILKEQIKEEEIRRQASELQLLQSQINPHFLYNTLDTLYWMAVVEEKEEIAQLTQALSDTFRIGLNHGHEMITIKEELKFIEDYLYIQNVRFDGKFIVQTKVDEEVYEYKIIKLVIQPFVENAIYHGLEPKIEQGNLEIFCGVCDGYLTITVNDDGIGMKSLADIQKGYAVQNVKERVLLHYGRAAKVEIESQTGCGTKVKLCLPMKIVQADTLKGV